jgi:hypothetical protein
MGGRFASEQAADLRQNHWPPCTGLRTLHRFADEPSPSRAERDRDLYSPLGALNDNDRDALRRTLSATRI